MDLLSHVHCTGLNRERQDATLLTQTQPWVYHQALRVIGVLRGLAGRMFGPVTNACALDDCVI